MIQRFTPCFLTLALAFASTAAAQQNAPVAKATPVSKSASSDEKKATPKAMPKARPLSVTVDLLSGTEIEGTLTDTSSLDMQTSFGTANMPLSEVAGIRFASADDPTTTVVMLNGDSVTGATDVQMVTVETEWGVAKINGQSVQSILFVPKVSWNAETGLNGKRWTLVNQKQPAAPQPTATTNTNNTVTYPTRSNGRVIYRGR